MSVAPCPVVLSHCAWGWDVLTGAEASPTECPFIPRWWEESQRLTEQTPLLGLNKSKKSPVESGGPQNSDSQAPEVTEVEMDAEGSGAVGIGSAWSPLPYPGWPFTSRGGNPKFWQLWVMLLTVRVTREQWPPPCCGHPQLTWAHSPTGDRERPPRGVSPWRTVCHTGRGAPLHPFILPRRPRPQTGPHTSGPSSSPRLPWACCWAPACPPTAGGPAHLQLRTRAVLGGRLKGPAWCQNGRWPQPRVL